MFSEFICIEKDGLYFAVYADHDPDNQKYIKLCTKDGKKFVSHKNEEFINFLISDLKRLGFPDVDNNGIITEENIPFSAYYIFNNQSIIKRETILMELLPIAILNDRILIQTFNGPPLEMHQLDRLIPVRNAVEKVFGKEVFQNITDYAWGTYYKNMISSDERGSSEEIYFDYKAGKEISSKEDFVKENWEGPGKEIRIEDFINSCEFNKIYKEFDLLNDYQLAAIISLFFWNEKLSILNAYLLISGTINKSIYVEGMLGINHEVLDGLFMLSEKKDINRHLSQAYSLYNDDANISIEYVEKISEISDLEYERFIKKLIANHENKTTELKTSFFRCQRTNNKDIEVMHEAVKAIAGLQNASGGHLLIGVNDDGEMLGIQKVDEFKNKDIYTQRIEQHIGKCLGQTSLSKIIIRFVEVNKNIICHIKVGSALETFCQDRAYNKKTRNPEDNSIFYLRQNNMTVALNSEQTFHYLKKVNN